MKVFEIANIIEKNFPLYLAEEWDNAGLLVGRADKDVNKVLVTLDVTDFVVDEAVRYNADMIVSHHPVIFSALKSVTDKTGIGNRLIKLLQNDIAVYSAHTNLDSAKGGINEKLADLFSLNNTTPILSDEYGCGLGRIGTLSEPMSAFEFAELAKSTLNTNVRISGDAARIVQCVAVGSGACDEIIPKSLEMGADIVLTGDCKYHRNLDFVEMGAVIVDAGHYPTEIIAMSIFENVLKGNGVEIIKSEMKDIFTYV